MKKVIILLILCFGCKERQVKTIDKTNLSLSEIYCKKFDFSKFLSTDSIYGVSGIFDTSCHRIDFFFVAKKDPSHPEIYIVNGFDQLKGKITPFKGTIKITNIFQNKGDLYYRDSINTDIKLVEFSGQYNFYEDSNYDGSGVFSGTLEFMLNKNNKDEFVDDLADWMVDGYYNFVYNGLWKNYKSNIEKRCIWGDGRCYDNTDFEQGDGELMVNKKYLKNGWELDSLWRIRDRKERWWKK